MEIKTRGRKSGQTKSQSVISDPIINPYSVNITEYGFDVVDADKGLNGFIGAYSTLDAAFNKIVKLKIADKKTEYSLSSFLKEYKNIQEQIEKLLTEK